MTAALEVVQGGGGWWIMSSVDGVDNMGPYSTRAEAERDRVGVGRTLRALERGDDKWFDGASTINGRRHNGCTQGAQES